MANLDQIREWYGGRTQHILERYGADAPRVHYHTGIIEHLSSAALMGIPNDDYVSALKADLRRSQVRLLELAAKEWNIGHLRGGTFLDSGCGLGGGAIFWAEQYQATVTAVSLVPEHLQLVKQFAWTVDKPIVTLQADAHELWQLPDQAQKYDAVIAIDSSCYMDLPKWFACLRQILKPGAHLYVCDGLVGRNCDPALLEQVNDYFVCKMVNVSEYLCHAHSVRAVDLSMQAANFFWTTYPLIHIQATMADNLEAKRASLAMHHLLGHMFRTHQLQYLILEVDPWS